MEKPDETTTPNGEKHSINWGALILWPAVILLLYVLSGGPYMKMLDKQHTGHMVTEFYIPSARAYTDTPLHKPLGLNFHLWAPGIFDKNGDEIF
jgi:hypothetical protein